MKVKTADLIGPALDWAVAQCEWGNRFANSTDLVQIARRQGYSTNWAQGGPIIEREAICIETLKEGDGWCATKGHTPHDFLMWDQPYGPDAAYGEGHTPLIAACRCLVASRFGDEVDVPYELV